MKALILQMPLKQQMEAVEQDFITKLVGILMEISLFHSCVFTQVNAKDWNDAANESWLPEICVVILSEF